jgi:phospho-N-acetylmuramoyl-pentapeptide-transferase
MFYHLIYPLHIYFSFLNIFRYITVRAVFAAITAFLIVILFGNLFLNFLRKNNIIQVIREEGPKKHLIEKRNIPTMGGILLFIAFLVSCILWCRFDNNYVYIVIFAAFWFALVGFLDDYLKLKIGTKGLSAKFKLVLQFFGSIIIMIMYVKFNENSFQYTNYLNIPFIKYPLEIPLWFYLIITVLIISGWSNAVNLTDGLDGLAAGLSLFVFATFAVMSYLIGNFKTSQYLLLLYISKSSELAVICSAFVGLLLGFLWFNAYPAQVFMGDVGSLMLGGVIGTIAILVKQEILLFVVGLVFVIEIFSVILQVTSYKITKKRIFKMAPLHHHFQLNGVSEPKIIIRFWIIAIIILLLTLSTLKLR